MKKFNFIYFIAAAVLTLASCDKFLDVMPDNRTELNSQEKIRALLTSAYPETDYMLVTEFSSDNVDDYGPENPNTDRFIDQVFAWEDVTETDNEDTENVWQSAYNAIAHSNQVIEAIEKMVGPEAKGYEPEMAEALICRAYSHFILANVFCHAYTESTADEKLGVTYMSMPEQGLNPKYQRETLAAIYDKIDADLQRALPNISDGYYKVPKYHFNAKAAYAFATRFYLFYEKWDLAVKYATSCLGSVPGGVLRDWRAQAKMTQDREVITNHFIDAALPCNLLLMTAYSKMGLAFGPYYLYSKYSSGNYLANNETGIALAKLLGQSNNGFYASPMKVYSATNLDRVIFWKLPYLFEYTDPVAQIGYYRTVYPAFTTDHVLLERAEANIILGNFDDAVADMNLWLSNISKKDWNLTKEEISQKLSAVEYATPMVSTVKKHLNAPFLPALEENPLQENLLHFCLLCKRVDGLGQGLRWFDVKRYGIEIQRRVMGSDGQPHTAGDILTVDDERRAIQIPKKVIDAEYQANPR
ncbi:MAG: RagB/SusD family nutrient uptake outer membrane protein [Bacteroidales bacterium]|nr:RagB/SusD family nutrient uptake outer membrane protein [Bacteroidales bacterium]